MSKKTSRSHYIDSHQLFIAPGVIGLGIWSAGTRCRPVLDEVRRRL